MLKWFFYELPTGICDYLLWPLIAFKGIIRYKKIYGGHMLQLISNGTKKKQIFIFLKFWGVKGHHGIKKSNVRFAWLHGYSGKVK